jgi:hypothetical protein
VKERRSKFWICACVAALTTAALGQKVKVGYDKSVDFSKYKTYTWAAPATPPTRPFLYESVVGAIDSELKSKGLMRIEKNGDLVLMGAGAIGFGIAVSGGTPLSSTFAGPLPAINATVWTGAEGQGQLMAPVPDGSLTVQFVDRSANLLVWSGTVTQKLDIEQKKKSLELVDKAITKLLKQFPPGVKD